MAFSSSKLLITLLALVAILVPSISAVEFIVGDEKGWTNINGDYQAWAQGKEFHVGDKLVFKYPKGAHNVLKVNGTGFAQCTAPAGTVAMETGYDVITLATEGRKWYICGVGKHCEAGNQKLAITVLAQAWSPAPEPASWAPWSPGKDQPTPSSATATIIGSASRFGLAAIVIGVIGTFFAS